MDKQEEVMLISQIDAPSVRPQLEKEEGMSFCGAITSIIATVTGAGLVFLPYRIYMVGIPAGLIMYLILSLFSHLSVVILMRIVKILPIQV